MAGQPPGSEKFSAALLGPMLLAVLPYAVIPALIGAIGGEKTPFLFLTAWRMGVVVGCLIALFVIIGIWIHDREFLRNFAMIRGVPKKPTAAAAKDPPNEREPAADAEGRAENKQRRLPFSNPPKWPLQVGLLIVGNCEYALLALSFQHINIAVAAAVFGTWVIINYALSPVRA